VTFAQKNAGPLIQRTSKACGTTFISKNTLSKKMPTHFLPGNGSTRLSYLFPFTSPSWVHIKIVIPIGSQHLRLSVSN